MADSPSLAAKLTAEFIGTLTLIYIGILVLNSGQPGGLVGAALAHGLAIAVMVSATIAISGGALNPAVTLAVWIAKKIGTVDALLYMVVQLLGGVAGALLAQATLPPAGGNPILQGLPGLFPTVTVPMGIAIEAILTFFLAFVVLGTAVDGRAGGKVAGLAIGFTITMDILAAGTLTGAAMNPARWFGPAVVGHSYVNWAVWTVGPLLGAAVAGLVWVYVLFPKAEHRAA
ncbi:MAG: aquaporin [Thermoplasmatota archaeon]